MKKIFSSISLRPKQMGVVSFTPTTTPYFRPERFKMVAVERHKPSREVGVRIGAVTVGGCPQLGINTLSPTESSPTISPKDIDKVDWSVFSVVGLARELQVSVFNPGNEECLIFGCITGTDEEQPEGKKAEPSPGKGGPVYRSAPQIIGSDSVMIDPGEKRIIRITPTVSSYLEPVAIRYHANELGTNEEIPFCIIDAFCSNTLLYGGVSIYELFESMMAEPSGTRYEQDSPSALVSKLKRQIEILERHGPSGLAAVNDTRNAGSGPVPRGMLTSIIHDDGEWGNVSHWPTISTMSLNGELYVVAYNPWSMPISASVSLKGYCKSSMDCESEPESD